MKKSVLSAILLFCSILVCCSPQKTVASYNDNIIQTPYGARHFEDDLVSVKLLRWYSQGTGDFVTDSINTRIIIDVCNISDGALSEIMGDICIDDIMNKPCSAIQIYKSNPVELDGYIDAIAWGLYARENNVTSPRQYENFYKQLTGKWRKLDDLQTLKGILAIIKERYDNYLKEM